MNIIWPLLLLYFSFLRPHYMFLNVLKCALLKVLFLSIRGEQNRVRGPDLQLYIYNRDCTVFSKVFTTINILALNGTS